MSLTGTIHQISSAKLPFLGDLVRKYVQPMSRQLGTES
jgi:hypothetical protein